MKLGKLFFATMLSGLAFTACVDNDDKSEWNDGSQPISFTSSIKGVSTRAVGSKWTAGDKIGIFMKAASGDLASAVAANKQHTTDANGNISAVDADNALYYPTDGSSVDFIAYYPYTASLAGNTYKVNVAAQTDQPAIDLLYSNNATGFAKGANAVPQLQFTHVLSQIVFNIEKDATIPSLNGLKVTFKGMNTVADFTLADGRLANAGTAADIAAAVSETATTATAIVLPAAALSDVKVVFELNNKTYTADYPQAALEGGKKYVHKVLLSDTNGQPVVTMDAAAITDWVEVPGGDINVDFGEGGETPEPAEVVLLDESFNADQGAFTIDDKSTGGMNFVWSHGIYQSKGYMKASGYYNSTNNACESWLVSPTIDLSKATKATLSFMHCDNYSKVDLATRQTVLTLWAAEAATENWEQLTIPTYGAGTDYVYVSSGDIDLSKYAGKSMKFAFKYVCNGSFSATWQIQDVKVVADGGSTVEPEPEPEPEPGEEVVLVEETFGTPEKTDNYWPSLEAYTGWTDTHGLTYSDPLMTGSYSNASIRSTSTLDGHIWFAATKDCALKIAGMNTANCTGLKLTYDITANADGNQDVIAVATDKGSVDVPSAAIATKNVYQSVELTLPDGITYIQFTGDASTNTAGYRVDNIKLVATSK